MSAILPCPAHAKLVDHDAHPRFFQVGIDDSDDLSVLRAIVPGVPDDELRKAVAYLVDGSMTDLPFRYDC
jgi:hypothetical protein